MELFNAGSTPVDLSAWSVQYTAATGTTWQVTPLAGTLQPGRYLLVQQAPGAGGTTPLPTPEVVGSVAMAAGAGKVALVRTSTALSGACPVGGDLVDLVGYGAADCREGAATAPAPSATQSIARAGAGCTDSNDNGADFALAAPTPRNGATSAASCP